LTEIPPHKRLFLPRTIEVRRPRVVEFAGTSQLMGFPELDAATASRLFPSRPAGTTVPTQVPSVSIIDPLTGRPNPRFWVLKLLKDELSPGVIVLPNETWGAVASPANGPPSPAPLPPLPARQFCGNITDETSDYLTLSCDETAAVISRVIFADYGLPTGGCATPKAHKGCSSSRLDGVVRHNCTGKHSCTINTYWPGVVPHIDPCFGKVKTLLVVAQCSVGGGRATPGPPPGGQPHVSPVYMQGYQSSPSGAGKRLLVVNTQSAAQRVKLDGSSRRRSLAGGLARVVDQASGEGWYRNETVGRDGVLDLAPFAVAIVHILDGGA
jgi:hypothetical protein